VLIALLYQLLAAGAAPIFWFYVVVDAVFLVPIGAIFWAYERPYAAAGGACASDQRRPIVTIRHLSITLTIGSALMLSSCGGTPAAAPPTAFALLTARLPWPR
jgi:hypothetical protein